MNLPTPKSPDQILIFVVDDEPTVAGLLGRILTHRGYKTHVFHDPTLVLNQTTLSPDLLITDYSMPGLTGLELMHICRKRWPGLKTLMVSGNFKESEVNDPSDRPEAFLPKPCDLNEVIIAVEKLLGSYST